MHKFITICAALFVGVTAVSAQNQPFDPTGKFSISVQGGPMYSRNENSFAYEYYGHKNDLFTWQASVGLGYDFTKTFALRGNIGYAVNPGAGNVYQTNIGYTSNDTNVDDRFFPYSFKSITYFVDAVLKLNGLNDVKSAFEPKLYFGLGGAHTYALNPTADNAYFAKYGKFHPWQLTHDPNEVIGFRLGAIAQYNLPFGLGFYADLCGEAYTDNFNGLMPTAEDTKFNAFQGYAGFPFDLRVFVSLGAVYHF